jgi:hypothetical protein
MTDNIKQTGKSDAELSPQAKETYQRMYRDADTDMDGLAKTNPKPSPTQKYSEVTSTPAERISVSQSLHDANSIEQKDTPVIMRPAEQQISDIGKPAPPPLKMVGMGQSSDAPTVQSSIRETDGVTIIPEVQPQQRSLDSLLAKAPTQPFLFPESTPGQLAKQSESLVITPLQVSSTLEPKRGESVDSANIRTKGYETEPSPSSPAKISLGELAAKLNQADSLKPTVQPFSSSATTNPRTIDGAQSTDRNQPMSVVESAKPSVNNETQRPILNSADQAQHREIAPTNPAAKAVVATTEKTNSAALSPTLLGQISNIRDSAHDTSGAAVANRLGSVSPERPVAPDKPKSDVDPRARIDTNSTERPTKVGAGKIETIDARSARSTKADGSAVPSSGSDLVKSNRTETFSTDKMGKTDKVDATKPHDDIKSRVEISNQAKREPLIIPGVITSRSSDSGKGGKGPKTDDSGKSDSTKVDGKKVDGGAAGIKTGGTTSDAASGRKNNIKTDKSDEKADQHSDTKIAASSSRVISGVAGRIVDSLSTIKDKLIPGAKPNVDSRSEKADGHQEFANHSAQPKPMDASLGIGRDLKPVLPSSKTEFVYNGKKPLADSGEDTLSSKTGGLKQALLQIFGNHPDIATDLKANTFPGPKTVPFENAQSKPGDRQTVKAPDRADKPLDTEVSKKVDAAYLRNQKGDKVPTGNLREELVELKANPELTNFDADFDLETEGLDVDLTNRQQSEDFTVQLGEIANGAASVPASELFTVDDTIEQTIEQTDQAASDDDEYDSRYLYYVKEGDTLRSIFDSQLSHQIGNTSAFEYFVKNNEQTVRLASVLSADSMSFVLQPGTVIKLPTPRQIARLKS